MLKTPLGGCFCYSKVCLPYHGECIRFCVSPDKKKYLPKKVCVLWRPFDQIIQLHFLIVLALWVNKFFHSSLCHERQWKNWQMAINFAEWLLDLPSIYLTKNNLPLGLPEKLNVCYSHKNEKVTALPWTYLHVLYVWESTPQRCLLY